MNTTPGLSAAEWVKSSYSNNGGANCLEWAPTYAAACGTVPVRDSKLPDGGPVLMVTPPAWTGLIGHLRRTTC
jgi:hypothetical protein